jgi:hypothetical protein
MYGKARCGAGSGSDRVNGARSLPSRETFNTLKNHGYDFEDNYGWVKQNPARILALLMVLALALDRMM